MSTTPICDAHVRVTGTVHVARDITERIKIHGKERPVVHVSCRQSGDNRCFSVRDNGMGIDPQNREQVFQLLKRFHGPDQHPGTGIGLAIARKIVERHGGKIWVESEPGKVTTFFFTIPKVTDDGR